MSTLHFIIESEAESLKENHIPPTDETQGLVVVKGEGVSQAGQKPT